MEPNEMLEEILAAVQKLDARVARMERERELESRPHESRPYTFVDAVARQKLPER